MAKDFPDLTGDGRVTRADVLKGRGVFKHGGRVKKMRVGGSSSKAPSRSPSGSRTDDLVPRSMLPDKPTIPEWQSFGYGAPAPKPRTPPNVKRKREGGAIKKMRRGGSPAPAPAAKPSSSALSKLGSSLARLGTGAARLTGMTSIPGVAINTAIAAKDIYDRYRDAPDTLPVQPPQRFYEEFYPAMRKGGKVKGHKVKKFQAGGMTLGGVPVGPAADPNAPVQGGFGTPFMPSVPVQQRQLGGTPGLAPPTVPNMGIAPGAFGGTPGLELPTVQPQPRPPMGRARPMPVRVPMRRPMPVRRRGMNEGGAVKKYAAGGAISSASRRADGIAKKGKTRGKMC